MQWFKDMKVGAKLISAFVAVSIITAIVGFIGISNMSKINDMADRMYDRELLGLSYIKEANIDLIYIGRARSNFLLATSQEERQRYLEDIRKSSALLHQNLEKAKPLFVTEKAKELFANFSRTWGAYETSLNQILTLAAREKLAERSAALTESLDTIRQHANILDDTLTELANQKEARAKQASDETTFIYQDSRNLMIALSVAGVVIGLVLGFLISRAITRPLQRVAEVANQLAEGDLSARIEVDGKDETGQLLISMQHMTTAIQALVSDANALSQAAREGQLATRADASRHQGEFRRIIDGLNGVMDAMVGPVNEITRVMTAIEDR